MHALSPASITTDLSRDMCPMKCIVNESILIPKSECVNNEQRIILSTQLHIQTTNTENVAILIWVMAFLESNVNRVLIM